MSSRIRYITLGNALTAMRLILLPVAVVGIARHNSWLAVISMALALLTDLLDGRISRYLGQASEFGRNLDTTIDFVFLHALFIALYAAGFMRTFMFLVIYAAMLATMALQMMTAMISTDSGAIKTRFGKLTGALEYTFLLFIFVGMVLPKGDWLGIIYYILFFAICLSAIIYISECIMSMRKLARSGSK